MPAVVLDTDVLSFLAKGDSRAALYQQHVINADRCVCFQTVAELRLWMIVRKWADPRRKAFEDNLKQFVVLPFDSTMADHWAEITAHRRGIGKPIDCGDAWIAAAAIRHGATLLTHNRTHYEDIPSLKLISYG
jgi:predicted nucleic acid-binding protein